MNRRLHCFEKSILEFNAVDSVISQNYITATTGRGIYSSSSRAKILHNSVSSKNFFQKFSSVLEEGSLVNSIL